jgi:hypothetical protein
MKWLRLLSLTLGISVAAASLDVGLAGHVERFRQSHSESHVILPNSGPSSTDYDSYSRSDIISEPSVVDHSASATLQQRCSSCGTQASGYYRTSEGRFRLKPGCHWVDPDDNKDLRTYCD